MKSFRLLSHNILANVWCIPAYYPNIVDPGRALAFERRRPAIYRNIRSAMADIVCLQEVEETELKSLRCSFHHQYHISELARNFPTTASIDHGTLMMIRRNSIFDRYKFSSHVWSKEGSAGQIAALRTADNHGLIVANLHLSWRRYGAEAKEQAAEVERIIKRDYNDSNAIIWCGDLNTTPDRISSVLPSAISLQDAFEGSLAPTWCSPRRNAKHRLDYILHCQRLRSLSAAIEPIPEEVSFEWIMNRFGSDHLPLSCDFQFV